MVKTQHEIRDPVHTFIRLDNDERTVLDSEPVQRLRQIHQLAMSYLVYPGATHRRFEHALGVMELAGRVFDVVTHPDNAPTALETLPRELFRPGSPQWGYWRRAIRMAALCHDLGHLPFSHAAEHELLPEGWNHERLSVALIRSPMMEENWASLTPPLNSLHIAKLAVGQKELRDETFSDLEAILSEIVVGDAFGVDRIDYLLRDSVHAGVAYGRFDHFRLIDTLRILPTPAADEGPASAEPQLGVEQGGLQSAEALLLARYFMFSQVYFHPVRRIYDIHLKDFLAEWLPSGKFSIDLAAHLALTDTEVTVAMARAARDTTEAGHDAAGRIMKRGHYKVLWQRNPADLLRNPKAGTLIAEAATREFGAESVRHDPYSPRTAVIDFPVLQPDGRVASAQGLSEALNNVPTAAFDFVFINPDKLTPAKRWLQERREQILSQAPHEE